MNTTADERLLDINTVAHAICISKGTVYNWVDAGFLPPPIHYGRLIRWRAHDINAWIVARHHPPSRPKTAIAKMAVRSLGSNPRGGGRTKREPSP